ncbi:hypothetical protein L484_012101 [Morus notabilis]|uniref:Uncharacterized protein n=1 Tax=Morus notabilis TaxID=981085 RepID=W9RL49_9ROSA|nr:hypothetical protein L484_012101 [Morus notabilis]
MANHGDCFPLPQDQSQPINANQPSYHVIHKVGSKKIVQLADWLCPWTFAMVSCIVIFCVGSGEPSDKSHLHDSYFW